MSEVVNKALAELLVGQHRMTQTITQLANESKSQADRIQKVIDVMAAQEELTIRIEALESKEAS